MVDTNTIRLFIPIYRHEINIWENYCSMEEKNNSTEEAINPYLKCYSENCTVSVDDKAITVEFIKGEHSTTQQFGIVAYLPVNNLSAGNHVLEIQKTIGDEFEKNGKFRFSKPLIIDKTLLKF